MPRCVHGVWSKTSSTGATNSNSQLELVADGGSTRRGVGRKGGASFCRQKGEGMITTLTTCPPLHSGALVLARNEIR